MIFQTMICNDLNSNVLLFPRLLRSGSAIVFMSLIRVIVGIRETRARSVFDEESKGRFEAECPIALTTPCHPARAKLMPARVIC
jgi:hypothetical protein